MHAGDLRDLGQVHRAELAGADQAHAKRIALRRALRKLGVQVHAAKPFAVMPSATLKSLRQTRRLYSPVRVSISILSPVVTNSGTCTS